MHGQQEGWPGRYPSRAIQRNTAACHDHVNVRMVGQCRAPCMEHRGDADARAEMARIGGDGEHRLRRHLER